MPINTYFQARGSRWAGVSVGTWGTLKNTTDTKQSQEESMGICVSPRSCRKSWVMWQGRRAEHPQYMAQPRDSGTLITSASGVVKPGCQLPPTSMARDACLSQDVWWQWDDLGAPNIPQPLIETTLRSRESELCEEPKQKEMEGGEGSRSVMGCYSFWPKWKRTEGITTGKVFSCLGWTYFHSKSTRLLPLEVRKRMDCWTAEVRGAGVSPFKLFKSMCFA